MTYNSRIVESKKLLKASGISTRRGGQEQILSLSISEELTTSAHILQQPISSPIENTFRWIQLWKASPHLRCELVSNKSAGVGVDLLAVLLVVLVLPGAGRLGDLEEGCWGGDVPDLEPGQVGRDDDDQQEGDGDVYLEDIEETLFIAMIIDDCIEGDNGIMRVIKIILDLVKSMPYTLASGGQR